MLDSRIIAFQVPTTNFPSWKVSSPLSIALILSRRDVFGSIYILRQNHVKQVRQGVGGVLGRVGATYRKSRWQPSIPRHRRGRVSIAHTINLLITVPHVGKSWRQGSSNDELFQRACKSGFPINFIHATFFHAFLWGVEFRCNASIPRI
jgi:hypothetical protein